MMNLEDLKEFATDYVIRLILKHWSYKYRSIIVSHREWCEGQTDASEAIKGERQENERWQDCVKK